MTETSAGPVGLSLEGLSAQRVEPRRDGLGPDDRSLRLILRTAITVPDHGGLRPWRFAIIRGAGQQRFGDALVAGLYAQKGTDLPAPVVDKMRGKSVAAPCAVMLIASPDLDANVPEWEQVVSASCTGYAVVLAAVALGFGAVWKSAGVLGEAPVRALFGLEDRERLLGWVNIGTPGEPGRKKLTSLGVDPESVVAERLTVID